MSKDPDILPCPFCGASASIEEFENGLKGVAFSVGCDSAEEESCMGYQSFTTFARRSDAIKAWNRRAK
jgi:Lar family restriction alleviation protein